MYCDGQINKFEIPIKNRDSLVISLFLQKRLTHDMACAIIAII